MTTSHPVTAAPGVRRAARAGWHGHDASVEAEPARGLPVVAAAMIALTVVFALLSGAYTLLGVGRPEWGWLLNHVLYDASYFLTAGSMAVAARIRGVDRRAWTLMAVALTIVSASAALFSLQGAVPWALDVSIGVKLLAYPVLGAALLLMIRGGRGSIDRAFLIDWLSLAVALVIAIGVVLGLGEGIRGFPGWGALLFALGTAALVALALAGVFDLRSHRSLNALSAMLLVAVLGDAIYALQVRRGTYEAGRSVDQLWQVAMVFGEIAPWLSDRGRSNARGIATRVRVLVTPLVAVVIASGLAALVLATSQTGSIRFALGAALAACAAVGVGRVVSHLQHMTSHLDAATTTAAHLMHELRQPVTAARTALGGLLSDAAPSQAEALREIDEQLERITTRVSVLGPSLSDRGAPCELRPLVARVVAELRVPPAAVRIDIRRDVRAAVDEEVIATVLRNVLLNAFDHGSPPVTVRATSGRDVVEVAIEDGGAGVPDHAVEQIFLCGESRHADDERGVGLALARALARAAGGHVVYAPRPDCPGRFLIRLPRCPG